MRRSWSLLGPLLVILTLGLGSASPATAHLSGAAPSELRSGHAGPVGGTMDHMRVPQGRVSAATSPLRGWISTADAGSRVAPLSGGQLRSGPAAGAGAVQIRVDATARYQQVDGFGAALTESSAHLLMSLSPSRRAAALHTLFDPSTGAGIDLVRLPLGASDFALGQYSYDDLPAGQTDYPLSQVSVRHDDAEIIPVLTQALAINPNLRVIGTPWSAPGWMKTSGSLVGGTLRPGEEDLYARYLTKVVRQLRGRGVPLDFLTIQNEPDFVPGDYPGMSLTAAQESTIINRLSPRLAAAALGQVQLLGYDHNWDDTQYPLALLHNPTTRAALAGTAWHCYAGAPDAQNVVHTAFPEKGIWLTECSGGDWAPDFGANLGWNTQTLTIDAMRAWSRSLLLWNLALDPDSGPHTGGCDNCRGVLTIDPGDGSVTPNVEWDVLALAGKAVRPGAVRIGSDTDVNGVQTVAYQNPDGSRVATVYNSWLTGQTVAINDGSHAMNLDLPGGSVAQVRWH